MLYISPNLAISSPSHHHIISGCIVHSLQLTTGRQGADNGFVWYPPSTLSAISGQIACVLSWLVKQGKILTAHCGSLLLVTAALLQFSDRSSQVEEA
ncbi:hypothetical protein A0H81_13900 [Grifola frondosa]|uniref:Uncharacterized protein n=1 Tax=Grifola frondosa TaxID=5627 RepID=A0A1C7LMX5_GRIFR|nr:hypothetical protein A0H81_13900 [Grifola frondosa]